MRSTAGDHRAKVAVIGEVDEEVDGRVEYLEHVADVYQIVPHLQPATTDAYINKLGVALTGRNTTGSPAIIRLEGA